jgi:hypothetical protein
MTVPLGCRVWAWHAPLTRLPPPIVCSELGRLPHVPLLQETLRRLVLPPYMAAHVEHLAADRVHGAAELAAYTVQVGAP